MIGVRSEAAFWGVMRCSKVPLPAGSDPHLDDCCFVCLVPGSRPSELGFNMGNQVGDPDVPQIAEGGPFGTLVLSGRCQASTARAPNCKHIKERGCVFISVAPMPIVCLLILGIHCLELSR